MSGIYLEYVALSLVFACFLIYMFWWNKREK